MGKGKAILLCRLVLCIDASSGAFLRFAASNLPEHHVVGDPPTFIPSGNESDLLIRPAVLVILIT